MIRRFLLGGPSDDLLRVLRVRGRTTGQPYDVPVRINTIGGNRYVVAMFSRAQWVKNLRATGFAEVVLGKDTERVAVHELHDRSKTDFMATYVSEPKLAKRMKTALGVDPSRLDPEDLRLAISEFPVFRLDPTAATSS